MTNKNPSFKVKANEFEFTFTQDQIDKVDLINISPTEYNLLHHQHSVNARLVAINEDSKKLTIEIEGENFEIELKDELDQMLDKMGFGLAKHKIVKEIKAPMPGMVLEIAVSEGQEIQEGDKILILEAMKMENSILAHSNATIKRIAVTKGQAVDKGQVLVELE